MGRRYFSFARITSYGDGVEIMNKMDVPLLVGGKEENGIMLVGKCRLVTAKVVGVGAVRFLCVFENDVKKCLFVYLW